MSNKHLAILMSDFYKQAHHSLYPDGISKLVAYCTPRKSRLQNQEVIVFGLQAFIKEYLLNGFNETFFKADIKEIEKEYRRVIENTMTKDYVSFEHWSKLHTLGYLPLEIKGLEEGTMCPMGVPCVMITNTHKDFAWLVEFIESKLSNDIWYPMVVATQAYGYRQIVNNAYEKTVDNMETCKSAISEFGYRGGEGDNCSEMAGGAFLTSFNKTATIPALYWLEDNYNCNIAEGNVGGGMISTEHSVMCSNYAVDGDEKTFIKKLLVDKYPTGNISVVCDSYDYWNVVQNIIGGELRQDVLSRQGCLFVRGDSGNPVDIICGEGIYNCDTIGDVYEIINSRCLPEHEYIYCNETNSYYKFNKDTNWELVCLGKYTPVGVKGTVEILWDNFGGTINDKGYKVLDSHVRAIYGDSITPARAERIYRELERKGFAACNVALGAGSFSMQCTEENGELKPFTRDTYSIAIKATYGETEDGKKFGIFKNPKTDTGNFKKSQNGMCGVFIVDDKLVCMDHYSLDDYPTEDNGNMLKTVFKDGKLYNQQSIHDIRNKIHNNKF